MIANIAENLDEHKQNDIDAMLVKSTILHGKLFEVVKEAEDPKSEKGNFSIRKKRDYGSY